MNRMLRALLDPAFRLWSPFLLLRAGIAASALPNPRDAPVVDLPGPDPDRILVMGGGIAVGFGVLSHELGIAGHIARQVSAATGRGVHVDILAEPDLRISDAAGRLQETNLSAYDAIVFLLGVTDAIRHTGARAWRAELSALLQDVNNRAAAGTRTLVVGIQPVRQVTTFDNRVGFFAEQHARSLDRESIRVCQEWPGTAYVPFQPDAEPSERYRSSATYSKWATQISPAVVEAVQGNHPLGDFAT